MDVGIMLVHIIAIFVPGNLVNVNFWLDCDSYQAHFAKKVR